VILVGETVYLDQVYTDEELSICRTSPITQEEASLVLGAMMDNPNDPPGVHTSAT
jgi:hypothetical protein